MPRPRKQRLTRAMLAAACLAALTSCTRLPPFEGPRIVVERSTEDPTIWQATYRLERPASRLAFSRPARFYREDVWEIVTPGWRFERGEDGDQLLVGEPATDTVRVRFPVYTENISKEYELFGRFTDGGLALYTGHLYVTDAAAIETGPLDRLELVPLPGETLVVQGTVHRGRTVWQDPHGDGTYAYFGRVPPLETDAMIAILDPGAPGWLLRQLERTLPEFFRRYTEAFAEPLPWKPVVLFSFVDADRPGLESGGGTLTGLIQMSATGRAWHDATPETSEQLLYLISHEAAHLWNGQLHTYEDTADSWMHEGSADAFADLQLFEAGAIDEDRLAQRRTDALNLCARGLRSGALTASGERSEFGNYYTCGNMIAVWSTAATAAAGDPGQLYRIWRMLFEAADPDDGSYNRATYFEALERLGADAAQLDALRAFLDTDAEEPAEALRELFAAAGVELLTPERAVESLRSRHAGAALRHLMAGACDGWYSFDRDGKRLRTFASDGCAPFAEPLQIVAIEGHTVHYEGDLALAATARRCAAGGAVALELEGGGTVRVPCSGTPPAEPAPLGFPP